MVTDGEVPLKKVCHRLSLVSFYLFAQQTGDTPLARNVPVVMRTSPLSPAKKLHQNISIKFLHISIDFCAAIWQNLGKSIFDSPDALSDITRSIENGTLLR